MVHNGFQVILGTIVDQKILQKNQSKICSGFSYRIFKTTYMLTFKNQFNQAYVRNRSPHDFVIRCHLLANVQSSL